MMLEMTKKPHLKQKVEVMEEENLQLHVEVDKGMGNSNMEVNPVILVILKIQEMLNEKVIQVMVKEMEDVDYLLQHLLPSALGHHALKPAKNEEYSGH